MSLNESHVEEVALEWFRRRQGYGGQVGELGYAKSSGKQTFFSNVATDQEDRS